MGVTLSAHVQHAISDLRAGASALRANAANPLSAAAADACDGLARHWSMGWAPGELSTVDRAILRMAQAAISARGPAAAGPQNTPKERKHQ